MQLNSKKNMALRWLKNAIFQNNNFPGVLLERSQHAEFIFHLISFSKSVKIRQSANEEKGIDTFQHTRIFTNDPCSSLPFLVHHVTEQITLGWGVVSHL